MRPILFALALLAIPPPAPAGSIIYDFSDQHYPYGGIARLEVDDGALTRGYFSEADVIAFGFQPFGLADLQSVFAVIDPSGMPTSEGSIVAFADFGGSTYDLTCEFGPASFDPGIGGYYQVTTGNYPGRYGYGVWTARIDPSASASVPEPTGLVLACAGVACMLLAKGAIR